MKPRLLIAALASTALLSAHASAQWKPTKPIEIHGVGSAEGGVIRKVVERATTAAGLKAKINDEVKLVGGDSDHTSFADKRVPYAFFFSGFHADYHRPSDHPEKLAYENMVKVATSSMDILLEMANLDEKPKFVGRAKPGFQILSRVTTSDGGTRPVSFVREWGNFRSFYTSLGHEAPTYSDANFIRHVGAGIMWAARREALFKQ